MQGSLKCPAYFSKEVQSIKPSGPIAQPETCVSAELQEKGCLCDGGNSSGVLACSKVQPSLLGGFSASKHSFYSCEMSRKASRGFPIGGNLMISGKKGPERPGGSWDTEH